MTESKLLGTAIQTRYGAQLEQCRDLVSNFVGGRLPDLFDQSHTALRDFAERAEDHDVQGRFVAAIGQLQHRRPDIEHIFHEELNTGFQAFGTTTPDTSDSADGEGPDGAPGIELSLVELDDMEESVATENLIARANADYFPDLYAMSQRLSVVAGGRKLKDNEIPAAPHHLVQSFRRAMEGLDVEVKVKVVLYAVFDKFVVKHCGTLYEDYNAILKSAGILPKLRPVYLRSPDARGNAAARAGDASPAEASSAQNTAPVASPAGSAPPDLGTELFRSILDLMGTRRADGQIAVGRNRPAPPPAVAAAARAEILAALSQAQARTAEEARAPGGLAAAGGAASGMGIPGIAGLGPYADMEFDAVALDRVRTALTRDRKQILRQIKAEDLSPVDASVIDLIGMLFEYMLNDPVLPNAAKALLSHLHTPYLKLALLDRSVLEDSGHPARRLLDEMVEAGSLMIDEKNLPRGIFPVMQHTVDRVLQEFADRVDLFDDLLDDLRKAVEEHQLRTDTVEQRAQAAARGREKLQLARQQAAEHIQAITTHHRVPEVLATFLTTTWLDQLALILLREKEGAESRAWRLAIATGEELVALFDPGATASERRARIERIPKLREVILREVQRMGSFNRATFEALGKLLDDPSGWKPALQPPLEAGAAQGKADAKSAEGSEAPAAGPDKELIERLRRMRVGTWFEFASQQEGAAPRRIKLSWVSPLTSSCMFVDRSGTQAEVKTLRELAADLRSGRAKVIPRPKHPFIERALLSIRKLLQSDAADGPEPAAG
jgi:hypothetical protein